MAKSSASPRSGASIGGRDQQNQVSLPDAGARPLGEPFVREKEHAIRPGFQRIEPAGRAAVVEPAPLQAAQRVAVREEQRATVTAQRGAQQRQEPPRQGGAAGRDDGDRARRRPRFHRGAQPRQPQRQRPDHAVAQARKIRARGLESVAGQRQHLGIADRPDRERARHAREKADLADRFAGRDLAEHRAIVLDDGEPSGGEKMQAFGGLAAPQ